MKTNQGAENNVVKTAADACVRSCQKLAAQFERAKRNILAELRGKLEGPEKLFRLALNEAEALAWQTDYPHLLFPTLAVEKVQAVAGWNARQQIIQRKHFADAVSN